MSKYLKKYKLDLKINPNQKQEEGKVKFVYNGLPYEITNFDPSTVPVEEFISRAKLAMDEVHKWALLEAKRDLF